MKRAIACFLGCIVFLCVSVQAKPQLISLTTQDGWILAGKYLPAEQGKKTVILLHELGKSKQTFETFASRLEKASIGYISIDLRGHGASTNKGTYLSFEKEGVDNAYNQMTRDVNAAVEFLKNKKVAEEDIMLIGVGLGANVAAKAAGLWPEVGGVALVTPVINFRDVLVIPSLRVYKGPVFIAAAADDKKTFLEASVIRNVAFLSSGEGKVTFATAYDKKGHELLDAWITPELLQWIQTPQKPPLVPDVVEESSLGSLYDSYENVEASDTEEALVPSILQ